MLRSIQYVALVAVGLGLPSFASAATTFSTDFAGPSLNSSLEMTTNADSPTFFIDDGAHRDATVSSGWTDNRAAIRTVDPDYNTVDFFQVDVTYTIVPGTSNRNHNIAFIGIGDGSNAHGFGEPGNGPNLTLNLSPTAWDGGQVTVKSQGATLQNIGILGDGMHTVRMTKEGNDIRFEIYANSTNAAGAPTLSSNVFDITNFTYLTDTSSRLFISTGGFEQNLVTVFESFSVVIPEPASLAMLGIGGLSMLQRRRRA